MAWQPFFEESVNLPLPKQKMRKCKKQLEPVVVATCLHKFMEDVAAGISKLEKLRTYLAAYLIPW